MPKLTIAEFQDELSSLEEQGAGPNDLKRFASEQGYNIEPISSSQQPPLTQKIFQLGTTPFRGTRALAVGLEQLIATRSPGQALQRAAEATQPGFQPKGFAESMASSVGEMGPIAPLFGPEAATSTLGRAALQGGATALSRMALQKAEQGQIDPISAGVEGALATGPELAMKGIAKVYPPLAARFTKGIPEAYQKILTDSRFLNKFKGTAEAVAEKARAITDSLEALTNKAKAQFDKIKEFYGLNTSEKELLKHAALSGGQPRDVAQIAQDFIYTKKLRLNRPGFEGIDPGEKLRRLWILDKELNENLQKGMYNETTASLKNQINNEISRIPGGARLQKARAAWSTLKGLQEDLGKGLSDPDTAPILLEKLAKNDLKGIVNEKAARQLSAINQLSQMTKTNILEPVKNELLAGSLRPITSEFTPKGVIGKAIALGFPGIGAAQFALSSPRLLARLAPLIRGGLKMATNPIGKMTFPVIAEALWKRKQDREAQAQ